MEKGSKRKVKKCIIGLSVIILVLVIGIIIYSLQFTIFEKLYENGNENAAKKVYSINKSNIKLRQQTDEMFSEKFNKYISKYKNDEITYEEAKECINKFIEYKDYSNKLEDVKAQKEKYERAEQYFEHKDYKDALPIYIELANSDYANLEGKLTDTKNKLKQDVLEQVNKLKQEKNYIEAINIMEETKKFYSDDRDFLDLLSEVKKLQQTKQSEEKERKKVEEIKSSIKIIKIWADRPNSAGGVDLYINWENLSDKIIKYVYFTVSPYNSVNDIVKCTIRNYSSFTAQDDGPYSKGQGLKGTRYYWENAWYNYSIKGVKLENVKILYMDGTSLDISEKYINYIQ